MKSQVDILKVPQNSENKPRGLCFSKALFGGLIFGGAYIWRGRPSKYGGKFAFQINWAKPGLIVGWRFTIFALFYFVFEGNFQVPAPGESLYLEGRFNGGFFALRVWGAYI